MGAPQTRVSLLGDGGPDIRSFGEGTNDTRPRLPAHGPRMQRVAGYGEVCVGARALPQLSCGKPQGGCELHRSLISCALHL